MPTSIQSVLGSQVVTHDQSWLNDTSTIGVQVCRSGEVVNRRCTIKTRYIPPDSTCVVTDENGTRVEQTIKAEPPRGAVQGGIFIR